MSSRALFQTASELAMSGNALASQPVRRASIEAIMYALRCEREPETRRIWLESGDGKKQRERLRKTFSHGQNCSFLDRCDTKLSKLYSEIYDLAIRYGAHPNPHSIFENIKIDDSSDSPVMRHTILHGQGQTLENALRRTFEVGYFLIKTHRLIWPKN